MRGRFWAGVVTGGLLVAALDRIGVRTGPWLAAVSRWGRRLIRPLVDRPRRPWTRGLHQTTRRWLARVGPR